MKRLFLAALVGLSGCSALLGVKPLGQPLTPEQQAILVEESIPGRNEWLHQNCEVKDVSQTLTPDRARYNASQVGANYVEVLYSSSPINLYVVMFNCPQIPPY